LTNLFGPRTYLNLNHLTVLILRRFNLQPNIKERNPVVKQDRTVTDISRKRVNYKHWDYHICNSISGIM